MLQLKVYITSSSFAKTVLANPIMYILNLVSIVSSDVHDPFRILVILLFGHNLHCKIYFLIKNIEVPAFIIMKCFFFKLLNTDELRRGADNIKY